MSSWKDRPRKGHICDECGKDFSSTHQLAQHQRIHTGEKPYKCNYCDKSFKQLSHVQQHTRLHTGERPYKCPKTDCGKAFIQLSNLNQHLKVHSNARTEFTTNLVCPSCSRIFKTESSLYSHKCRPGQRSPSGSPPRETRGRPPKSAKSSHDNSFIPEQKRRRSKHNNHSLSMMNDGHQTPQSLSSSTPSSTSSISHSPPSTSLSNPTSIPFTVWTCTVCGSVFPSQMMFVSHVEQMRGDGRHHVLLQPSTFLPTQNQRAFAT